MRIVGIPNGFSVLFGTSLAEESIEMPGTIVDLAFGSNIVAGVEMIGVFHCLRLAGTNPRVPHNLPEAIKYHPREDILYFPLNSDRALPPFRSVQRPVIQGYVLLTELDEIAGVKVHCPVQFDWGETQ